MTGALRLPLARMSGRSSRAFKISRAVRNNESAF